ncbi:MAG: hypothetical protein LBS91_03410 [Clostridiales Family XIII bacterium]|jgi:hypothetical protein|nr:hypothetical protein [Clostridiales Family XIII bacterium]
MSLFPDSAMDAIRRVVESPPQDLYIPILPGPMTFEEFREHTERENIKFREDTERLRSESEAIRKETEAINKEAARIRMEAQRSSQRALAVAVIGMVVAVASFIWSTREAWKPLLLQALQ